jgi:hypothetical protein
MGQQRNEGDVSPTKPPPSRPDDRSRDSSDPPPPLPGTEAAAALARAEHAVGKSREALISAADASDDVATIALKLGNSADPVLGIPARGLLGVVGAIVADLHLVGSKLDTFLASYAADRAAHEKAAEGRRGSMIRLGGMIAAPSITLLVAAVAAWLAGFHR